MFVEIKRFGILLVLLSLLIAGCRGETQTPAATETASPTNRVFTQTPTYDPYVAPAFTPPIATNNGAYSYPGPITGSIPTPAASLATDSYPAPQVSPIVPTIQQVTPSLVGPGISPYPGPATSIPTALGTPRTTSTIGSGTAPAITLIPGTLGTPTPTARISKPLGTPPPPPSTIYIWHSWKDEQLAVLDFAIQAFQDQFPDVYFNLLYIPRDELFDSYRQTAYNGEGPSILFGPAEWGPSLYDMGLVADLIPYTNSEFLSTINSAALETGMYRGALIGLPHTQRGILLIRNQAIMDQRPNTLEDMINLSNRATRGSIFGAYIERGSFFSSAHLEGLGGKLMDEDYNPAFNDQKGIEWLDLLVEFERLGPTSFNSDNDLELFKDNKVGMIIDGSWNLSLLAEAIGADNITVDPWPTVPGGKLSGYVQTDALFLNANTTGDEQLAALRFMGFLLDKEVQGLLSEAGFIPSVIDAKPEDKLIEAAMIAFRSGTPYPSVPTSEYLRPYWDALDAAIKAVVEDEVAPETALQMAQEYILNRLNEIRNQP